jgi:hypothetical protein
MSSDLMVLRSWYVWRRWFLGNSWQSLPWSSHRCPHVKDMLCTTFSGPRALLHLLLAPFLVLVLVLSVMKLQQKALLRQAGTCSSAYTATADDSRHLSHHIFFTLEKRNFFPRFLRGFKPVLTSEGSPEGSGQSMSALNGANRLNGTKNTSKKFFSTARSLPC